MTADNHVDVIAEVGSNHAGDYDLAVAYVEAAARAGADAVKFQTLRRDLLVAPRVREGDEWVANPVHTDFANVGLPDEWHAPLKEVAEAAGIEFLSTPFHLGAVDMLEGVGVRRYKIASGDITFTPLLERVGATGKPVILSTGASTLFEVDAALSTLRGAGAGEICVLHCVASYPPAIEEMNLRAIQTLREHTGLAVGISDHTRGEVVPLASVALGARVVERHVTFDRAEQGPDHPFATTFEEFTDLVSSIRRLEAALGTGEKAPTESELARRHRFRRSPYDPETLRPADGPEAVWLRPRADAGP